MAEVNLNLKNTKGTELKPLSDISSGINPIDTTAAKVNASISIPTPVRQAPSLEASRVTIGPVSPELDTIKSELKALAEPITDEPNYMIRLQNLIGLLLSQLIKISNHERSQKEELQNKVTKEGTKWGEIQVQLGNRQFFTTFLSFGLQASQYLFINQQDRDIVSGLAKDAGNNFMSMVNSGLQASQKQIDVRTNLLNTKINDIMTKGQSDSSNKSEMIQFLKTLYESLQQASR